MASGSNLDIQNLINTLQCLKFGRALGKPQKDALHAFKAAVATAYGQCEKQGVPARTILAFMVLRASAITTDELVREMSGGPRKPLGPTISGGVCQAVQPKSLTVPQLAALHQFQGAVGTAFGECEKEVDPSIILAVFSEHAAELNIQLALQGP